MTRASSPGLGVLLAVLLAGAQGCGATQAWNQTPAPVQGAPAQFALDSARAPAPGDLGCAVYIRDPGTGVHLELVRSTGVPGPAGVTAVGDYRAEPAGSYGLAPSQLLRVECPTRRPLGAVH